MQDMNDGARMPSRWNSWRTFVAEGLYISGMQRVVQAVSRSFEFESATAKSGMFPKVRRTVQSKFVILCYHRVGTQGIPLYSKLAPEAFEEQMHFLRQRYRLVSLAELCRSLRDPGGSGQSVALTFDDGYRDVHTFAFPILKKYAIPATIYLTVEAIERGEIPWYDRVFLAMQLLPNGRSVFELDGRHEFDLESPGSRFDAAVEIISTMRYLPDGRRRECCREIENRTNLAGGLLRDRMLTWNQVEEMHEAGIAFGSHTMTHPVISRLESREARWELAESRRVLETRLATPVVDFAFPFGKAGDCGAASGDLLASCGYRSAATTVWGVNTPGANPYRLRRIQIGEGCSLGLFAWRLNQVFLQRSRSEEDSTASGFAASGSRDESCGSVGQEPR